MPKPKQSKQKKKFHMGRFILVFVILSIFIFTGLAMYVQIKSGVELSPTLIGCFFGFCTGELWMLASIKKTKINMGQKDNEYKIITSSNYGDPSYNSKELSAEIKQELENISLYYLDRIGYAEVEESINAKYGRSIGFIEEAKKIISDKFSCFKSLFYLLFCLF